MTNTVPPQSGPGGISVKAPSGATFQVMNDDERLYFTDRVNRYTTDNHFVNVADLQDVDRLLTMELMVWRWGLWLSNEQDYWGQQVDPDSLSKSVKEYSMEIRQLKKLLGIDKSTRDKERGESVPEYLENLRRRAREFGVMRESQSTKAITLFQELKSLVEFHDNADERERREQNIEIEDVLEWLRSVAFPEFNAIDEHFRENQQKYWIKEV